MEKRTNSSRKGILGNTLLILAIALVSVTAVTYAWFSISDNARLSMMRMDVTTGPSLRMDLVPHATFEEYRRTLTFREIADRIRTDTGVDIASVPIEPVTTRDGVSFVFEDGSAASYRNGTYVEFTLHFMSVGDMYVHLTSTSSKNADDGTRIWSDTNRTLSEAMRLSVTKDTDTFIYDPGTMDIEGMTDSNTVFFIPDATDVPVVIRVWIEGTDPACTNDLKGSDYSVRMRFEGSDENNQPLT